jgi:hypothetical protein
MSINETEFIANSLEALNFDPLCDCHWALLNIVVWRCRQPARWVTNMPSCGKPTLSCAKHRYRDWLRVCSKYRTFVEDTRLKWRRI